MLTRGLCTAIELLLPHSNNYSDVSLVGSEWHRTSHSYLNKAERATSILSIALQHVSLKCKKVPKWTERQICNVQSMQDTRKVAEMWTRKKRSRCCAIPNRLTIWRRKADPIIKEQDQLTKPSAIMANSPTVYNIVARPMIKKTAFHHSSITGSSNQTHEHTDVNLVCLRALDTLSSLAWQQKSVHLSNESIPQKTRTEDEDDNVLVLKAKIDKQSPQEERKKADSGKLKRRDIEAEWRKSMNVRNGASLTAGQLWSRKWFPKPPLTNSPKNWRRLMAITQVALGALTRWRTFWS